MTVVIKLIFFFIVFLYFIDSYGQELSISMQRFFPKTVIPAIWYDAMNVSPSVYRNLYKYQVNTQPVCFDSNCIDWPRQANYYSNDIQKLIIRSGMINRVLKKEQFNPCLTEMKTLPQTYFMSVSLPVIKKEYNVELHPGKPDFLKDKKPPIAYLPHTEIMNIATHKLQERPYSYENLVKNLSRDYPWLIKYLWNEIPDPPKIMRQNYTKEQKKMLEMLNEALAYEAPRLPDKLKTIEIQKAKWTYSGYEHLTVSQTYVNNWVQGGESSQSFQSDLDINAIYSKDHTQWHNEIKYKIGFLSNKIIKETGEEIDNTRINEDMFEFRSQYGYQVGKKWDYGLMFKLHTQIFNG
jgi:hypothetical protein